MKIALVQTNPIIGDFDYNLRKITHWIEKAKHQNCDLVIFPELATCGYPPQDLLERAAFVRDHDRAVASLLAADHGIGVICGLLSRHRAASGKPLHNSASLFENGPLFSAYKRLLPTYDVFDEGRYFQPGERSESFHYKGMTIGLTICEDIWYDTPAVADLLSAGQGAEPRRLYPVDPVRELVAHAGGQLDLLINIAASPFQIDKTAFKTELFAALCRKHRVPLLYVNQVGGQDSLLFDGQSLAMDAQGRVIARARAFREEMLIVDTETLGAGETPTTEPEPEVDLVHEALLMGLRDYTRKCGFSKVVLGLSGGIDSALTAALACQALGAANVLGVALPSPYSSAGSLDDARALAANLGMRFEVIPIGDIFQNYLQTLAPFFDARPADVTEQNIQARIRGNILMALANKHGYLLLSTGNKSEMAVGYCTLYGDMSGGLAVISDVPKMLVYKLARYINRHGEIIPWPSIDKPPSAELAPDQKDQDDLPPYEILDAILAAYLEEHRSLQAIVALGFAAPVVKDVIRRITINEHKRKQAPVGLKVTSKAFGYGRRYPTAHNYWEK
jgi:NAD+ synthetase